MRNAEVDPRRQRPLGPAIALALLLGACTTERTPPVAVDPTPPPEPVACIQASQIPAEPPMVGSRFNGDAKHDLQVLAPNAKALRDWGQLMHAQLEKCATQANATVATAAPAAKP